jgi:hypothetical protein
MCRYGGKTVQSGVAAEVSVEAGEMKKVVTWVLVAFLVFYIVTQPSQAANIFRQLGSGVAGVATGFGDFISNLS